jgi:hypothetical protein
MALLRVGADSDLPEGEYRVALNGIPPDFELQSFSNGPVDRRQEPLRIAWRELWMPS